MTYTYDGDGKRVSKSTGKLYWTGMGSDPLDESDAAGNINEEYVFYNGKRIARADVGTGNAITAVHYYFADHLGSADVITSASGVIEQESDYYPFGGEHAITSGPNNYKFTGKERDAESGLDNFGARYDASSIGRFMTPDPLLASAHPASPQTWNRYSYALNNPLSIVDPEGLWNWAPSAGGTQSDDELRRKSKDKSVRRKDRGSAKRALKFREQFRKELARAASAATSSALNPSQRAAVAEAVSSYGTENDQNGVNVGVHEGGDPGYTEGLSGGMVDVSFRSDQKGKTLAADIAHEGVHVNDNMNSELFGDLITRYQTEYQAYMVQSYTAQALGMGFSPVGSDDHPEYAVWSKGWRKADIETYRARGVTNLLRDYYPDSQNHYLVP